MELSIREATSEDLTWANDRYASVEFVRSTAADHLVVAWLTAPDSALPRPLSPGLAPDHRVGIGRIVWVGPGIGELGGMYVAPEARGRGVADAIVRHLLATGGAQTLFCIPFTDLFGLYERCGFRRDRAADLPEPISAKLAFCATHYDRPVTLLRWDRT